MRSLRDQGVAVLYISHRLDEVHALADRITVLRDGRMVGTWPAAGLGQREMAELMVGRPRSQRSIRPSAPPRCRFPSCP